MNPRWLLSDRIQHYILMIVLLFLATAGTQLWVNDWIDRRNAELRLQLSNQLARRDIGQSVYRRLLASDNLILRLSDLQDPRDLPAVRGQLQAELDTIYRALRALQHGGVYEDTIGLNLPGLDEFSHKVIYTAAANTQHVLEVLELSPKVRELGNQIDQLDRLVRYRMEATDLEQSELAERIAIRLKATGSILLRGRENIARVLYETDEYTRRLEQNMVANRRFHDMIGTALVSTTLILSLGLLLFVLKRVGCIIDERRQARLQVERSLANTESILEAVPVGIAMVDKHHRIVRINKAAAGITGRDVKDLVKKKCHALICPAERGKCPVHDLGQKIDHSEKTVPSSKGGEIPVYKTVKPLIIDGEEMLLEAFIDITELKEARERFRLLLDSASEGIFGFDEDGNTTFVNPAAARMLGYEAQELKEKLSHDLIHHSNTNGSAYPQKQCQMATVLRTSESIKVTNEVLWRKDGTCFPAEYTSTPIVQGDKVTGAVVIFNDVTVRREIEAAQRRARRVAEQADRAKSEFLARMSHEIRTPMNGVLGMAQLLSNTRLNSKQREFVVTIERSANTLLQIINDILDLSKIEAGRMELNRTPFKIRDMVEDTVELLAQDAQGKGLELCVHFTADLPTTVVGDAHRLRQVLTNLIGNAVKFTKRGEIVLKVERCEQDCDGDLRLRFEVEDTGVGMTPEDQSRIFEPFAQASEPTSVSPGGTGLGLAICRQLVRMMGGEIDMISAPGRGSRFFFDAVFGPQQSTEDYQESVDLRGCRLLIADHHASVRAALHESLTALGAAIVEADSTDQLRAQLLPSDPERERFDLLLLERTIYDSGLIEHLARNPQSGVPPVVLLTPLRDSTGLGEPLPGVVADLCKPVRTEPMLEALGRYLGDTSRESSRTETDSKSASQHILGSPLRVLVAEDNEVNQLVAEEMLLSIDCIPRLVADGHEAVEACRGETFDIVLMDCQMPKLDGYQATRLIRDMENEAKRPRVPIVALTANAMQGAREASLNAGMDDYLTKPFTLDDLREKLSKWASTSNTDNEPQPLSSEAATRC